MSCKEKSRQDAGESDMTAATDFIQAALKGNYDLARTYMLHDSINDSQMDAVARVPLSSHERQGLFDASIHIHSRKVINDSTTVIVYSNSFRKDQDTLKLVRQQGKWLVDFKYLFNHDQDTLTYPEKHSSQP